MSKVKAELESEGSEDSKPFARIWNRELAEFFDFACQLIFDFAKAVLLMLSYWTISVLSHSAMQLGKNDAETAWVLHVLHSIFLILASFFTLSFTLLRLVVAPIHQLFTTVRRIREGVQGEDGRKFLDVELELQAALARESQCLRFQGFRMNEALNRQEFASALSTCGDLRLLFMAPYGDPRDGFEREHNRKFNASINALESMARDSQHLRIEIRVSEAPPPENIIIFDDDRARVKPVPRGARAANHSEVKRLSRGKNERELLALVARFDSRFAEARVFRTFEPREINS